MTWKTFKGSFERTGAIEHDDGAPGVGDGDLDTVWSVDDVGESSAAPAVAGDLLVAGQNPLAAYRLTDGGQVWAADLPENRDHSPAVGEGFVFTPTHGGDLVALDLETGLQEWTYDANWVSASPTVHDGRVLVPTRSALVALDPETGETQWEATGLDGHIKGAPVVADGTAVVGGERGLVLGVDVETGQQAWLDEDRGRGVTHAPAALANLVFVPNGDDLLCYDADTGERRWTFDGDNLGTPAIADRTIYVAGDRTLYALDGTGSEDWHVEFEYSIKHPTPAVIDDTVVVAYQDALYGYDPDSGEEVFEYPTDRDIRSIPIGAYGAAVIGTGSTGTLEVLLPHGEELDPPEGAAVRDDSGDVEFVAADGWSTGRGDPRRTGALPDASGPDATPGERWQYGDAQVAGVALQDGTAYVAGATAQELAAVDVETGIASWELDAGERLVGQPVVADGTVYTCDDYGVVYALDADSGEPRWEFDPQGFSQVEGSPAVVDGTIYLPTGNGDVYAVDADTGEQQWSFETRESFNDGVVVTDELVITPCDDGTLYGLDRERGEQRWEADIPGFSGSYGIGAGHGTVFVGTGDPSLAAFDPETGIEQWTADLAGDLVGTPAVGDEYVFAAVEDRGKALVALDVDSGAEAWSTGFSRQADAAPALADGIVYVPSGEGLHAVEADSGRELFGIESYRNSMPPVVGDGYVIFQTDDALRLYDADSAGDAEAEEAAEADTAEGAGTAAAGAGTGGPGSGPDAEFGAMAAEVVADDPEDPDDDAIRATALGVLIDAWHAEFDRQADLDFETLFDHVTEQLPGVTEQTLEFNLEALDSEGAVDFEPAFKTTALRALGLDHYYGHTEQKPVPDRDLLGVLQPLYNSRREGDSMDREALLEATGLDPDYLDRIMWMLADQGVFAGDLYISGPDTGAVDVYAEGAGDGWWVDAQLTDHGRQLFEEMR